MPTWDETKRKSNVRKHGLDFVVSAAQWEAVIARAPGEDRPLTAEEEARWAGAVLVKGGGYKAARAGVSAKRKPEQGGVPRLPVKLLVSVRYSPEVIAYFKSEGAGWQTRMDDVLKKWVSAHTRKARASRGERS